MRRCDPLDVLAVKRVNQWKNGALASLLESVAWQRSHFHFLHDQNLLQSQG